MKRERKIEAKKKKEARRGRKFPGRQKRRPTAQHHRKPAHPSRHPVEVKRGDQDVDTISCVIDEFRSLAIDLGIDFKLETECGLDGVHLGMEESVAVQRPKNASNGIRFGEAEHPGHDTPENRKRDQRGGKNSSSRQRPDGKAQAPREHHQLDDGKRKEKEAWKSGLLCEKKTCDALCPSYHLHKRLRGAKKKEKEEEPSEEEKKKDESRVQFAKREWRRKLKSCAKSNAECFLPGKYHPGNVNDPMDKGFDLNPLKELHTHRGTYGGSPNFCDTAYIAEDKGIEPHHVSFVNQLLKRRPELMEFVSDYRLVSREQSQEKPEGKVQPPQVQPKIDERKIVEVEQEPIPAEDEANDSSDESSDPPSGEETESESSDSNSALSEDDEEAESEPEEEDGYDDIRVINYFAKGEEILGPPVVPVGLRVVEVVESTDSKTDAPDVTKIKFSGETAEVDVFSNLALCESEAKWLTFHLLPFYMIIVFGVLWCRRFDVFEDLASHTVRGRLHQFKHYVLGLPIPGFFEQYWWSFDPRLLWFYEERDPLTGVDLWEWRFQLWTKQRQTDYTGLVSYYFAALLSLLGDIGNRTYVAISVVILVYIVYCSVHKWFWGPKRMLVLPGHLDNYIDDASDNNWCGRMSSTRALHGCEATTVHRVKIYTELYNLLRAEGEFRNVQTTQSDGSFRPSAVPRLKDILRTFVLEHDLDLNPEWAANTVSYIVTQEHLCALHCQAKAPSGEERGILNGTGGRRSFQSSLAAGLDVEPSTSGLFDKCRSIVLKCLLPLILLYLARRFVSSEVRNTSPGVDSAFFTTPRENLTPLTELSTDLPLLTAEWYTRTTTGTPPSQRKNESSRAFGKISARALTVTEAPMNPTDPSLLSEALYAQLMTRLWSSTSG